MKGQFINKLITNARCLHRLGIIRFLRIQTGLALTHEAYSLRWHGQRLKLRKHSTDYLVFREILVLGQYDIRALDHMPMQTIVDLGANIGLASVWFKSKYPKAKIIAVEPEQDNFRHLQENIESLADVYALNAAVWHSPGRLGVYDAGAGQHAYKVGDEQPGMMNSTEAITIDDIMDRYGLDRIDLLKIDIEGAEKELFSARENAWLSSVGCIVIELHDWLRAGCAHSFFNAIGHRPYTVAFKGGNVVVLFGSSDRIAE